MPKRFNHKAVAHQLIHLFKITTWDYILLSKIANFTVFWWIQKWYKVFSPHDSDCFISCFTSHCRWKAMIFCFFWCSARILDLFYTALATASALYFSWDFRQTGTDLKSVGSEDISVFRAPRRCGLFGRLSEMRENMPLLCAVLPQKFIFVVPILYLQLPKIFNRN